MHRSVAAEEKSPPGSGCPCSYISSRARADERGIDSPFCCAQDCDVVVVAGGVDAFTRQISRVDDRKDFVNCIFAVERAKPADARRRVNLRKVPIAGAAVINDDDGSGIICWHFPCLFKKTGKIPGNLGRNHFKSAQSKRLASHAISPVLLIRKENNGVSPTRIGRGFPVRSIGSEHCIGFIYSSHSSRAPSASAQSVLFI